MKTPKAPLARTALGRKWTILVTVAALLLLPALLLTEKTNGTGAGGGLADPRKVKSAYLEWAMQHERGGGDRNVVIGVGWSKGLSYEYTKATGWVRLDLVEGRATVEVNGLSDSDISEVWLVEDGPGPESSIAPEPEDRLWRIGRLRHEPGAARLEARLDPERLRSFEIDLVVVARTSEGPITGGVLFGTPTLFQRLYTRSRREQRVGAKNPAVERARFFLRTFAPTVVHAARPLEALNSLVAAGENVFFNEQFKGNGRSCGTCHPDGNNLTIDPAFIATLQAKDPLFVAEFDPNLSSNFENPTLMRLFGLILENVDGFDDLAKKFVMRGVPHLLGMRISLTPAAVADDETTVPPNQRTGWSGDGAPGNGTLREFAIGAVIQHFTKTLKRQRGKDFVLPTSPQLDQLEAFQLALGPQEELLLPLMLKSPVAQAGQQAFLATQGPNAGKCVLCHFNAGANVRVFSDSTFADLNFNFNTGVENFPNPADATGEPNPADGGFGTSSGSLADGFGDKTFNTPSLVGAADTAPFFHDNSVNTTIEDAVNFYNSTAFNNSPGGDFVDGIALGQFRAVGAFLRVINALENIRSSIDIETRALDLSNHERARRLLRISIAELEDAVEVLGGAHLHRTAVNHLKNAIARDKEAIDASTQSARNALINQALVEKIVARADIVE